MDSRVIYLDFWKENIQNLLWKNEKFDYLYLFYNYLLILKNNKIKIKGEFKKHLMDWNYKNIYSVLNDLKSSKFEVKNSIKEIKMNENMIGILNEKNELFVHGIQSYFKNSLGLGIDIMKTKKLEKINIKKVKIFDFGVNHVAGLTFNKKAFFWGKNYLGECGNSLSNILYEPLIIDLNENYNHIKCGKKFTIFYNLNGNILIFGKFGNIITKNKNLIKINLNLKNIKKIEFLKNIIFYLQNDDLLAIDINKKKLLNINKIYNFEIIKNKILIFKENEIKYYEIIKKKILFNEKIINIKYDDIKHISFSPNSDYMVLVIKNSKNYENWQFKKNFQKFTKNNFSQNNKFKNKIKEINNKSNLNKEKKIKEIKDLLYDKISIENDNNTINKFNKINKIKSRLDYLLTINVSKKEEKDDELDFDYTKYNIDNEISYLKETFYNVMTYNLLAKLINKFIIFYEIKLSKLFFNNLKIHSIEHILIENNKLKKINKKIQSISIKKINNILELKIKNRLLYSFKLFLKVNKYIKFIVKLNKLIKKINLKYFLGFTKKLKIKKKRAKKIKNKTNYKFNSKKKINNYKKLNFIDSQKSISDISKKNQSLDLNNTNLKNELLILTEKNKNKFISSKLLINNFHNVKTKKNLVPG